MKNIEIVNLHWIEKDWDHTEVFTKYNDKGDYGIYQIYGDHPVYGENALLYIGKAKDQTYSTRLNQHDDLLDYAPISCFRKLHLSYFLESEDVSYDKWGEYIDFVETLLINSHLPAYNSKNIKKPTNKLPFGNEVIILNWEERGKLLPEVSSIRYSYKYGDINYEKNLKVE